MGMSRAELERKKYYEKLKEKYYYKSNYFSNVARELSIWAIDTLYHTPFDRVKASKIYRVAERVEKRRSVEP